MVFLPGFLPEELCHKVVAEYGSDPMVKRALVTGNRVHPSRTCDQLQTRQDAVLNTEPRRALDGILEYHLDRAARAYEKGVNHISLGENTGALYLRYSEGQFYKQHCDQFPGQPRLVTISIALNDDFEGGEWAWFDRGMTKRFQAGDAIMFPSNFMYPHEILPVTKGTRHALVSWYYGR
jgi:predicted 2-oxoglutarate/Fe(II)-dependent dioxygenase YbiX